MDQFKWRFRSKIVASVDLIVSSIAVVVYGITVIFAAAVTFRNPRYISEVLLFVLWILLILAGLIIGTMFWCAVLLKSATSLRVDPESALGKAKFWLTINIVFLSIAVVTSLLSEYYKTLIFVLIVRGTFIGVVGSYVKELEQVAYSPSIIVFTLTSRPLQESQSV